MTTNSYLVVQNRKTTAVGQRFSNALAQNDFLPVALSMSAAVLLLVPIVLTWWFGVIAATMVLTIPFVLLFIPLLWVVQHQLRGKLLAFSWNTGDDEVNRWHKELVDVHGVERDLHKFIKELDTDDFAYSSAYNAWCAVKDCEWDMAKRIKKMRPYLKNPRSSTQPVLDTEFKAVRKQKEQLVSISDGVIALGLKSASFLRVTDQTHLEILERELADMCETLDEVHSIASHALPAVGESGSKLLGNYTALDRETIAQRRDPTHIKAMGTEI
jgi:hypothetical protein